jgi:hypothetical protein
MQELCLFIKDQTYESWAFEQGEAVQANRLDSIFNKIVVEVFQNLKKEVPIQVQETSRTPNRHDQNRI